jgi:hypothetical protein|tara:strand:- start:836 stop:1120 length:285 start_codon:yes stop_codon:yes gene_type:complete
VLQVNFEYGRKSVQARDIKVASISQVREQAKDLGLYDSKKRLMYFETNESTQEDNNSETENNVEISDNKEFDTKLEDKIHEHQAEPKEQLSDTK